MIRTLTLVRTGLTAATMLAASAAFAVTVPFSTTVSTTDFNSALGADGNGTFTLSPIIVTIAGLGANLASAQISVTADLDSAISFTQPAGVTFSGFTDTLNLDFGFSVAGTTITAGNAGASSQNQGSGSIFFQPAGTTETVNLPDVPVTGIGTATGSPQASDLAAVENSFDVVISGTFTNAFSGTALFAGFDSIVINGTVDTTSTFATAADPVPLPGTLLMFAAGLLGVRMLRANRKAA